MEIIGILCQNKQNRTGKWGKLLKRLWKRFTRTHICVSTGRIRAMSFTDWPVQCLWDSERRLPCVITLIPHWGPEAGSQSTLNKVCCGQLKSSVCHKKKWIIQEETRSRKEETRSRKHAVHLTWLISSDTSKTAVTCSHVKQIKKLWHSVYSHYFLCSKCDLLPVFVFLLLLSFLLLKWHITHSNNLIQTSSGRVLLDQGRTLQGVFVIFKQSHFDVVHSITKSNQSPSGNNVLLTFTNL